MAAKHKFKNYSQFLIIKEKSATKHGLISLQEFH